MYIFVFCYFHISPSLSISSISKRIFRHWSQPTFLCRDMITENRKLSWYQLLGQRWPGGRFNNLMWNQRRQSWHHDNSIFSGRVKFVDENGLITVYILCSDTIVVCLIELCHDGTVALSMRHFSPSVVKILYICVCRLWNAVCICVLHNGIPQE